MISEQGILKYLAEPMDVRVYDELSSTNKTARELEPSLDGEALIIARRQSGGRGRMGRSFFSPEGGLYMSLLLRPKMSAAEAVKLTSAAAVAVSCAIDEIAGVRCGIKWVNDVYLDGRKVCGILTEAQITDGALSFAVLGIGVNLVPPKCGFPEEIKNRAGSVFDRIEADEDDRLAAGIVNEFMRMYRNGAAEHLAEYRERSFLIGREVDVMRIADGECRPAVAVAIDDECRLVVRYADGSAEALGSGDVSVRGL